MPGAEPVGHLLFEASTAAIVAAPADGIPFLPEPGKPTTKAVVTIRTATHTDAPRWVHVLRDREWVTMLLLYWDELGTAELV
jgi:hypothetical protein